MKEKTTKAKIDSRENEGIEIRRRRNPFVMVDVEVVNDKRLSWKAKGILFYLLSKPDGWKVIVKDIINHGQGGKHTVYSALNELKACGYYRKFPVREGGKITHWQSVIYEYPADYEKDIREQEKQAKKEQKSNEKNEKKSAKPMDKSTDFLLPNFQDIENLDIENLDIENQQHSNININQSNPNQNVVSIISGESKSETFTNNQSLPSDIDTIDTILKTYTVDELADKIDLEGLKEKYSENHEEINILFDIMCDVLTIENPEKPTIRISKQELPFIAVKQAYSKLTKSHIEYVIRSLNNNGNKFKITKNTENYCKTSLFHSLRTITYYYDKTFKQPEKPKDKWEELFERKQKKQAAEWEKKREDEIFDNFITNNY